MLKWLLLIGLGFAVTLSMIFGEFLETEQKAVERVELMLHKPQYEWVRSTCQPDVDWCMGASDYIKHQMYMAGLKHEAGKGTSFINCK